MPQKKSHIYGTFSTLWHSVLFPILDALQPKTIVEIGSDQGHLTRRLLSFCQKRSGALHVIDPDPKYNPLDWQRDRGSTLHFHRAKSLDALPRIPQYDLVLIDGDHNWYTVFHELKLIEKQALRQKNFPVILLHDVTWPYDRRDAYYNPADIPEEHRKPYERKGLDPQTDVLQPYGGFNRRMCHALASNGSRNGVLSAIEDFLRQTTVNLRFLSIPGIHGTGVIFSEDACSHTKEFLSFLHAMTGNTPLNNHLREIEKQRVNMVIAHEELQRHMNTLKTTTDVLRSECTDLRARLRQIQHEHDALLHLIQHMEHTRSWRLTAPLRITEQKLNSYLSKPARHCC
ncbi:class I SAM-dependent methyltransferase [Candidatus Peregrinibacteria bacterium]|nr:class I SAM-dependent methyltransferase [Candidatus Peregrinibacteria bacterium]